jgi:hypothetical protein
MQNDEMLLSFIINMLPKTIDYVAQLNHFPSEGIRQTFYTGTFAPQRYSSIDSCIVRYSANNDPFKLYILQN